MFKKIAAIIVTYSPKAGLTERLEAISSQVDYVCVVDNCSNPSTLKELRSFQRNNKTTCKIILCNKNHGLGKAQNIGIEKALEQNCDWVLLFDDDSHPSEDMVNQLKNAYSECDKKDNISILAPRIIEEKVNFTQKYVIKKCRFFFKRISFGKNKIIDNALATIASGSLIKADSIKKYGYFREDFFIDYIDTEFCLRLIANNQIIVAVYDAVLSHNLGDKKEHNITGGKIISSNHSPQRRFTIYRNRIWVWKEYFLKVPSYIIYDMTASTYDVFRIILFENNRLSKLKQILRGIFHGIFLRS